ncbi:MAG TPA: multicopper oxidase domain-containing protein, partial [Nocardioides sp.]|nr:multicopper oxidase domain-containing protein [Nocardioides sp.]
MHRWVKWTLIVVGVFVLTAVTFGAWVGFSYVTARVDTVGEVDFDRKLLIPPLEESEIDNKGRRVFDLTMYDGHADLGRDEETATWGVNASYLGPTLRAKRGEEVLINVTNELGEDSTLHWHGMHLPAEMDGGPHQMIDNEDTWSPTWRIDQPAATLWYHPHPHEETALQVYRGVAGMFILDDREEAKLPLPRKYGVDDIPVI